MDSAEKCPACGSTLAANGECPDCGGPEPEPEGLDDYEYDREESPGTAGGNSATAGRAETREGAPGPVPPVAGAAGPRMTAEEHYGVGEERPAMSPAKREQLIQMMAEMAAKEDLAPARAADVARRLALFSRMLGVPPPAPQGADTDDKPKT